jgi:hypothetical protein
MTWDHVLADDASHERTTRGGDDRARMGAVQIIVGLSIAAFSAAAWGIIKSFGWCVPALTAAAVLGLDATLMYLLAVRGEHRVANVAKQCRNPCRREFVDLGCSGNPARPSRDRQTTLKGVRCRSRRGKTRPIRPIDRRGPRLGAAWLRSPF